MMICDHCTTKPFSKPKRLKTGVRRIKFVSNIRQSHHCTVIYNSQRKGFVVPWATILRLLCVWQSPKICLQLLGNPDLRWEKNPKPLPKTSFAAWAIISSVPCPIRAKHQPSGPACFRPENCHCSTPPWYYSESKTPAPSFLPQLRRGYSLAGLYELFKTAFLTAASASKSRPRHVRKLSWRDALNYYSSTQTQASERTLRRNLAAPAVSSHRCNVCAQSFLIKNSCSILIKRTCFTFFEFMLFLKLVRSIDVKSA